MQLVRRTVIDLALVCTAGISLAATSWSLIVERAWESPNLIIAIGQVASIEPLELQLLTEENLGFPRVWARATIHVQETLVGAVSPDDTLRALSHNSLQFAPDGGCREYAWSGGHWVFPGDTVLFVSARILKFLRIREQRLLDQFWVLSDDLGAARQSEVLRPLEVSSPNCSVADLYAHYERVWSREYDLAELRAKIDAEIDLNSR